MSLRQSETIDLKSTTSRLLQTADSCSCIHTTTLQGEKSLYHAHLQDSSATTCVILKAEARALKTKMTAPPASLAGLPDEVIQSILFLVPPQSSAAVEQTSRRFADPANEPLLWRYYCKSTFRYWDRSHDFANIIAGKVSAVDWKQLYIGRHLTDRLTTDILNSILARQPGRIDKFQRIVNFGYDAKDTLIRHLHVGLDAEDVLARR